jgi:hypothetical protein
MTRFDDGPAKGTTLRLMRAPYYLRVCVGPLLDDTDDRPNIDALDQFDDLPRAHEQLFAYRLTGPAGWMHVKASGGRGGFQTMATYRLVEKQPTDAQMRTNEAWALWCEDNRPPGFV